MLKRHWLKILNIPRAEAWEPDVEKFSKPIGNDWYVIGPAVLTTCKRISLREPVNKVSYELTESDANFPLVKKWLINRFSGFLNRLPFRSEPSGSLRAKMVVLYCSEKEAKSGKYDPNNILFLAPASDRLFGPNGKDYDYLKSLMISNRVKSPREPVQYRNWK
jgi:hypothetical protein